MLNSKGFTLVEMLFSLFIIMIVSVLSLSYHTPKVGDKEIKHCYMEVQSIIEEARVLALSNHEKVQLLITEHNIGYQTDTETRVVRLPKGIYFSNIKNIYFNKNGTINQGNHIMLGTETLRYKIVFNVGSGDFYLQQ